MRKVNGIFAALLFVLFATPAMATIDSSHHDIPVYYGASAVTKDKCFYCHGIKDLNSSVGVLTTNYGIVGGFCVARCHSGAGAVGAGQGVVPKGPKTSGGTDAWAYAATGDPMVVSMAPGNSHGDNTAKVIAGAAVATPNGSGLPYTTGAKLECTSCHSVHDSSNAPFLWAPLQGASVNTGLCDRCHASRTGNNLGAITSGAPGNHPVDFAIKPSAALTRNTATVVGQPNRHGRTISIDWTSAAVGGGVFDVPTPTATLSGVAGVQYMTGGHTVMPGAGGLFVQATDAAGAFLGCYTCHSAHMQGGTDGSNNLTVVRTSDSANTFNPLCMGCHGAATTWAANATDNSVGGNGPSFYGHPYGSASGWTSSAGAGITLVGTYPVSVGGFTFTVPVGAVEAANTQTAINFGAAGQLKCTTCHDVHLGVNDQLAIANLGQAAGSSICNACHNGSEFLDVTDIGEGGAGEAANSHHRTTAVTAGTVVGTYNSANDANDLNINGSWLTGSATTTYNKMGDLTDGLQCADCHVFNGTAHNW